MTKKEIEEGNLPTPLEALRAVFKEGNPSKQICWDIHGLIDDHDIEGAVKMFDNLFIEYEKLLKTNHEKEMKQIESWLKFYKKRYREFESSYDIESNHKILALKKSLKEKEDEIENLKGIFKKPSKKLVNAIKKGIEV